MTPGLAGIGFRRCFRLLVREQEKLKGDEKNNQTAKVSLPNSARYEHRSSGLELPPKLFNPNHLLLTAVSASTSNESSALRSSRRPLTTTASIFCVFAMFAGRRGSFSARLVDQSYYAAVGVVRRSNAVSRSAASSVRSPHRAKQAARAARRPDYAAPG